MEGRGRMRGEEEIEREGRKGKGRGNGMRDPQAGRQVPGAPHWLKTGLVGIRSQILIPDHCSTSLTIAE